MISEWMDGLYRTENGYEDYRKLTAGAGFGSGDRESSGLVLLYENLAASLLYVMCLGRYCGGNLTFQGEISSVFCTLPSGGVLRIP